MENTSHRFPLPELGFPLVSSGKLFPIYVALIFFLFTGTYTAPTTEPLRMSGPTRTLTHTTMFKPSHCPSAAQCSRIRCSHLPAPLLPPLPWSTRSTPTPPQHPYLQFAHPLAAAPLNSLRPFSGHQHQPFNATTSPRLMSASISPQMCAMLENSGRYCAHPCPHCPCPGVTPQPSSGRTPASTEAHLMYSTLLSRVGQAFKERVPVTNRVNWKDNMTYGDALDGRKAINYIHKIRLLDTVALRCQGP